MNFMTQLRIGPRLALSFGAMILLIVSMTVIALQMQGRMAQVGDEVTGNIVPSYEAIHDTVRHMDAIRRLEWRHVAQTDEAALSDIEAEIGQAEQAAAQGFARYARSLVTDDTDRANLAAVTAAYQAWRLQWAELAPLSRAGARDPAAQQRALAMKAANQKLDDSLSQAADAWFGYMAQHAALSAGRAAQAHQTAQRVLLGSALIGLLGAVVAGVSLTRSFVQPMRALAAQLECVARGDLTLAVQTDRRDELGDLQRAMANTVTALQSVVGDVRGGVESVSTASNQIAAGNLDLSSRTEQQASSLQQTASAMEEFTGTLRQSAAHAQQASDLAGTASEVASRGGQSVERVVQTMAEISDSSRRIADITGVIDGIAFQTNILALNAAVEAARAGEQGRGFAVVAGEVRTLAQRSAEAAREIKSLIGQSVAKIEAGGAQAATAGQAMADIVAQVGNVSTLIREIALAAREQSAGIGSVNDAINQMDQVTQQNAALVEQSAAAAGSLAQQAQRLSGAVALFRLPQASEA
jgi:methyl-accepting chemotaxis protein